MRIHILSSGSHGNMTILDDSESAMEGARLILDCGIKGRALASGLGATASNIDGAFVTHAHKDHCSGAGDLLKHGIKVYASYETLDEMGDEIRDSGGTVAARPWEITETDSYRVMPFPAFHDAANPLNFLVKARASGKKVAYITDTGHINTLFAGDVDAYIIECNYIDDILDYNARTNPSMKILRDRLSGTHLSLAKVKAFFERQFGNCPAPRKAPKIMLAHISTGNGDAKRMVGEIAETVKPYFGGLPEVAAPEDGAETDI